MPYIHWAMTLKPDDQTIMQWLIKDLNPRTLILVTVGLVASHFAQSNRITVVETQTPAIQHHLDDVDHRLDVYRDQLVDIRKTKLETSTYNEDQARLADTLRAIQESQGRIENILMERRER